MTIPATLYDISSSPEVEIASVTVTTSARGSYAAVQHKLDDGWVERINGGGVVEMRITAEGVTEPTWMSTLYSRLSARSVSSYRVTMVDGDTRSGSFVIEELAETGRPDDGRRRFRLVLLSAGQITYGP